MHWLSILFVKQSVRRDDFFKNLPSDEIIQLMAEVEPEYRRAYVIYTFYIINLLFFKKATEKEKIGDLLDFVRAATLRDKDDIVLQSKSSDDCNDTMRETVDIYAESFVKEDEFFKSVPEIPIEKLKDELEHDFRGAYDE